MRINVIDEGCVTIRGLEERCHELQLVCGPGKVYKHEEGVLFVADDDWKVLLKLPKFIDSSVEGTQ